MAFKTLNFGLVIDDQIFLLTNYFCHMFPMFIAVLWVHVHILFDIQYQDGHIMISLLAFYSDPDAGG